MEAKPRALFGEQRAQIASGGASRPTGIARRTEIRARRVSVDLSAVAGTDLPDGADAIELNLFPEVNLTATKGRFERPDGRRFTWTGKVSDDPLSMVVLVGGEGPTYGSVFAHGKHYSIRGADAASQEIVEIDQSAFPPEKCDEIPAGSPGRTAPTSPSAQDATADTGSNIDVLVVYTPAARNAEGGTAAITSLINLAVAETNASYGNSAISPRLSLVHGEEVTYTESGDWVLDLNRLAATDGYMDNVHALRDAYGADVVVLIINSGTSYCGIADAIMASASSAFALVQYDCATGYYSFGHEIGHLQGARHDRYVDPTNGWSNPPNSLTYNHGDVHTASGQRTVMAYNDECAASSMYCTRLPYWSNPGVLYPSTSTPMGSATYENNARVLNETAYTVANFRQAAVATARLTVQSTYPASGVWVTANRADRNGISSGTTAFTLTYSLNTSVTLTAQVTAPGTGDPFASWTGCASTNPAERSCTVSMTANKTVVANYTPDNYPPTLNAISNLTVGEDAGLQTVALSGISAGPAGESGQAIAVSATSSNPGLIPDPPTVNYVDGDATGSLTFTPVANAFGTATVTVTVADDGVGPYNSFSRSFVVTVTAVNDPPTLDAIGDVAIDEDSGLNTVPLSGISAGGGESQFLTVTAVSSNKALIPNPTVVYASPAATGSLRFTPAANASGAATITVTVKDWQTLNNNVVRTFAVVVSPVNDPPTLGALWNRTLSEDAGLQTIWLSGISAGGWESQTLTVTALSSNPALIPDPTVGYASPAGWGSLRFTPVPNAFGVATVTVTVDDGQPANNTFSRSFLVTVNAVNDAPTLDALPNMTLAEDVGLQTVALTGISAGLGESQTLTVTAVSSKTSLIPHPAVSYTSPDATGSLSFTPSGAAGTATITVTVKDGPAGRSIVRSFVVKVNDPPTLSAIGDVTIDEDAGKQTVALGGISAGGGERQPLKVTATSSNTGLIPNPVVSYASPNATGILSFTPKANAGGTATITVTVTDWQAVNNTFARSFTVTVTPVNDPPTLNALWNRTIGEDAALQTIALSGISAGGGESQLLTVTAVSSNPALIPDPTVVYTSPGAAGSLRFTPAANAFGTTTVTVTVNDGPPPNNTVARSFVVTVYGVNDKPTLNAIGGVTIDENAGQQTVLLGGISAGGGESQPLKVAAYSSKWWLIPSPTVTYTSPDPTGSLSFTPAANASGTATITVTVKDMQAANNTVVRTFLVTVSPTALVDLAGAAKTPPEGETAAAVVRNVTTSIELQAALTAAAGNGRDDVIRLAGGTYLLSGNANTSFAYASAENNALAVEGGWTPDFSLRATNIPTELTNDVPTPMSEAGGVLGITSGGNVQLDGVAISGGVTSGNGGGLFVSAVGSIVVGDCRFEDNASSGDGGGLYLESTGGDIRLHDSAIRWNGGANGGGGLIRALSASATANEISDNTAAGADGGLAITVSSGGELVVSDTTIFGNSAASGASGLSVAAAGTSGVSLFEIRGNIVYGNGAAPDLVVAADCDYAASYLDLNIVGNDIESYESCPDDPLD